MNAWKMGGVVSWALLACGLTSSVASGLLKPLGGGEIPTRITSHEVFVVLNNGFAQTRVEQTVANLGDRDEEVIYSFPLPKDASLSELWLSVNGVERLGEVIEKEKARKLYEEQRTQGKDTALAEQNGFKTFDISIGRIPAGAEVKIRLVYYQPLEVDLQIGRYLYPLAEGNTDDDRIPFWAVDDQVDGPFRFELILKSAFPIKEVRVPGYESQARVEDLETDGNESANAIGHRVVLESAEGARLNRDVVVYYRLDDAVPARVEIIPYKVSEKDVGTLMAVVTPAADLQPLRNGRDWVFVLDVSGSMGGAKIATLAEGVNRVLGDLSPQDRFRIVTFNNRAQDLTGGYLVAEPARVQEWIARMKGVQADGGTALFSGLEIACVGLDEDRTTGMILVTDGVCNVGPTRHKAFLDLTRKFDLRLFTFVIGNSANQPLLERLAKDSNGFAMNISDTDDLVGRLIQAKAKVLNESFRDVKIRFLGEKVTELTPVDLGSLYAGQQAVLFGRYRGEGTVTLQMTARIGGQEKTWTCRAELPAVDTGNPELERLWAMSTIQGYMEKIREEGERPTLRKAVQGLGTQYSLVTDYTSMVVLEEDLLEKEGIQPRNADRVNREHSAQQVRKAQSAVSHRVDEGQQTFQGRKAPGLDLGTGPVGPLFLLVTFWMRKRARPVKAYGKGAVAESLGTGAPHKPEVVR